MIQWLGLSAFPDGLGLIFGEGTKILQAINKFILTKINIFLFQVFLSENIVYPFIYLFIYTISKVCQ